MVVTAMVEAVGLATNTLAVVEMDEVAVAGVRAVAVDWEVATVTTTVVVANVELRLVEEASLVERLCVRS